MNENLFVHTTTFNSILKRIIKFACTKSIALKTNNVKSRVALLINEAPLIVLETAGPYLLQYAEHIKAHDEQFFLENDYSDHVIKSKELDSTDKKNILNLIDLIKKIYKKCNAKERMYLNDAVDDLLIAYCGYLCEKQQVNEKKE